MKVKIIALISSVVTTLGGFANEPVDIAGSYQLGEVVVTGTNNGVPQRLLPYSVSVIDNEQLESTGQTQVLSAISGMVPSLFVTQRSIFGFGVSNGGSGHIKLRGVGGDRASGVLMMVDGQPQFAGIYSHHIADFYDKEYVERVEVLRGPGSVLYGSNAMAGAINVITKNPPKDGVSTTLQSQYGSYNTWLSSVTNTVRYGRIWSTVSLSYNRTDGNIRGMDFKQVDGYAKVGYDFSDRWSGYVDYTLMNFKGNDPFYPKLSKPESTEVYHQDITRGEAAATVTNSYGSTNGTVRFYYNYGNHFVDDPRHFHSKDDRIGLLLYQNFHPWTDASATAGFDFDCDGHPEAPKMKDIGIAASLDPVAVDQACLDMVFNYSSTEGDDAVPLQQRINRQHGTYITPYAESIGLGSTKYTLVKLDE